MFSRFVLKIKRKETPFYAWLYRSIKMIYSFNLPSVKIIHLPLYHLDYSVKVSTRRLLSVFWSVPLFKARCIQTGKGLSLPNGIPLIVGSHLKIYLDDNVTLFRSIIGASKVFDEPVLRIGKGSTIGYGTAISVAKEVTIGDNSMISPYCVIMDNDDHPISPQKRLRGEGISKEEVAEVKIGNNVWIGAYCTILKGVSIGHNSVIATHSVISKDVMENCVYAGYPARPTLRDIHLK